MINQIAAQCRKLIPVLAVKILEEGTSIQREFSIIKVRAADRNARDEVIQMANIFRAKIIDVSRETLTVGIFGDKDKTPALTAMLADLEFWKSQRRVLSPSKEGAALFMMTTN